MRERSIFDDVALASWRGRLSRRGRALSVAHARPILEQTSVWLMSLGIVIGSRPRRTGPAPFTAFGTWND
jgi:hypothetical protein